MLVNNLIFTNLASQFYLPQPRYRLMNYDLCSSRGCPRKCQFCYKAAGIRYRMAVPRNEDPQLATQMPLAKRSAIAIKDWLVQRLALELEGKVTAQELERELAERTKRGEIYPFPDLEGRILVTFFEDDPLFSRERNIELCREIQSKPMVFRFYEYAGRR